MFTKIESFSLPRPVNWIGGPGGLQPDPKQCGLDNTTYAFVATLEDAASTVTGDLEYARYRSVCVRESV